METNAASVSLSLDDCFDSAVALHPLSMTCKQMHAEFQYIHFTATKARWTLSVNNFNLDQLELFGYYIDSEVFSEDITWVADKACMPSRPVNNVDFALRFQTDENAAGSAAELCGLVLSSDRDNYDTMPSTKMYVDDCRSGSSLQLPNDCTIEAHTKYDRTGCNLY